MAVRSLLEGLVGEGIGHLVEERLMAWVSTAQSEHSDARMIQEDFAADESMRPQAIDRPGAAEELHPALFVGAAEVDHTAGGWALEVQIPVLRKRSSGRSVFDPGGLLDADGLDEAIGATGQSRQIRVMKATPHESLPSAIVALDAGLEAGFSRGDEDGCHAQLETDANDPSERISVVMSPLESRVVVELPITGQADPTPVIQNTVLRPEGPKRACFRPGSHQASMERDRIENVDQRSVLDTQVFDEIEGVHFGVAPGHVGQVPSEGWGRTSRPMGSIDGSAAFQNACDGSDGRHPIEVGPEQLSVDGHGSILSEVTVDLQGSSQVQDLLFKVGRGSVHGACRTRGMGGEIDAIQTLRARPSEPVLNGGQTEAESPGHGPHGVPASHGLNDPPASLFNGLFWVMGRSPFQPVFEESIPSGGPPGDLRTLTLD